MAEAARNEESPQERVGQVVYGEDVRSKVLERLAAGWSLRRACDEDGMPDASTVIWWTLQDEDFAKRYARARQVGYLLLAEELIEIADDGRNDTVVNQNGDEVTNHDVVARSRLRLDTRKWMLAKMLPRMYGEKAVVEHSGPEGGPIEVTAMTDEQLQARRETLHNRLLASSIAGNGNGKH